MKFFCGRLDTVKMWIAYTGVDSAYFDRAGVQSSSYLTPDEF